MHRLIPLLALHLKISPQEAGRITLVQVLDIIDAVKGQGTNEYGGQTFATMEDYLKWTQSK